VRKTLGRSFTCKVFGEPARCAYVLRDPGDIRRNTKKTPNSNRKSCASRARDTRNPKTGP